MWLTGFPHSRRRIVVNSSLSSISLSDNFKRLCWRFDTEVCDQCLKALLLASTASSTSDREVSGTFHKGFIVDGSLVVKNLDPSRFSPSMMLSKCSGSSLADMISSNRLKILHLKQCSLLYISRTNFITSDSRFHLLRKISVCNTRAYFMDEAGGLKQRVASL